MPRKKKTEEVIEEVIEKNEVIDKKEKPVDYGTGWSRINNMIQEGVKEEKNE